MTWPHSAIFTVLAVKNGDKPQICISLIWLPIIMDFSIYLKIYVFDGGHYIDVIMTTMVSQYASLTIVYSTVYSDADQRKYQSSASLAFMWGIYRDRWIPRTKGQLRGKCFHLITSSWSQRHEPLTVKHIWVEYLMQRCRQMESLLN